MQGFRPRAAPSDPQTKSFNHPSPNPKRSPSPKIARRSSSPSDSGDSRVYKASERKSSSMSHSFPEKQKTMRVSEMQQQLEKVMEDMKRAKEDRSQALEELEELKKRNTSSAHSNDRILMLELEVEKAKESEMKLLESLISQTKQLEETKILLEEAKQDIRNIRDAPGAGLLASVQTIQAQEVIRMLRNELRLALQAEEKSKKAMDDFAIALKEVTTEVTQTKEDLYARSSELEKVKAEAEHSECMLRSTEQILKESVKGYDKLKLEFEESAAAWKTREDSFLNCIKFSEEDMEKKDEENRKLDDANKAAKEENSRLRDIIKQAVNEATVAKDSLAIARNENYELKEQLFEKEGALERIMQELESLKASETVVLDHKKGTKSQVSSSLIADSMLTSNLSEVEPFEHFKVGNNDRKIYRTLNKFSSDRWDNPRIQNGTRRSVGEADMSNSFALDKKGVFENRDMRLNSDAFDRLEGVFFNNPENDKQKKKKTVFGRFGDALRRRSFRKT